MQGTEEQPGVIPLAIEECFSYVSTSNDDRLVLYNLILLLLLCSYDEAFPLLRVSCV